MASLRAESVRLRPRRPSIARFDHDVVVGHRVESESSTVLFEAINDCHEDPKQKVELNARRFPRNRNVPAALRIDRLEVVPRARADR
jgi:hypothetical protein